MKYISLCSGIEAASVAWEPLGWKPIAFSEIEPFCCSLLEQHYPDVPNLGDVSKIDWSDYKGSSDVVVGGTPCFVAGTQVICANKKQGRITKAIEDVEIGDMVLTHQQRYKPVVNTYKSRSETLLLTDISGRQVECTPNHPFLAKEFFLRSSGEDKNAWVEAKNMKDRRWRDIGSLPIWSRVDSVEPAQESTDVYNLEVADDHTYTANGIVCHNCQAFSVAGGRGGLMDERGRLMLDFIRCVRETSPTWVVWENVPGVLSQDKGKAFGTLLGELENLGYSCAWRVLDAQFFGVAQRRRRVFVVGHARAGCAAAVLFESDSVRGLTQTSREKRQALTAGYEAGVGEAVAIAGNVINRSDKNGGNGRGYEDDGGAYTLTAFDQHAVYEGKPRAMTMNSRDELRYIGGDGSYSGALCSTRYKTGKQETLVQEPSRLNGVMTHNDMYHEGDCCPTETANQSKGAPIVNHTMYTIHRRGEIDADNECSATLTATDSKQMLAVNDDPKTRTLQVRAGNNHINHKGGNGPLIQDDVTATLTTWQSQQTVFREEDDALTVRYLTPTECERLQGFPDGYTDVEYRGKRAGDTPRYKALGNSMAVPVMRWIGERIEYIDEISGEDEGTL